jgi:NAD(P)-dependent dehydrogenase (short-subunit alcohol dehydrogenase family)
MVADFLCRKTLLIQANVRSTTQRRGSTSKVCAWRRGTIGIMRSLANELAQYSIRVNSVHPTTVNTVLSQNRALWSLFDPTNPDPSQESATSGFAVVNALPIPWVESIDVSNAILFLASDEARFVTGVTLPIDAGAFGK